MFSTEHLNLIPPLAEAGGVDDFLRSGRMLLSTSSPLSDTLAVFAAANTSGIQNRQGFSEQPIFFANSEMTPSAERRLFIGDTSIIFAALQNLMNTTRSQGPEWLQNEEGQRMIRKLTLDYINFTKECWIHASQAANQPDAAPQYPADHYRILYSCLSLFGVLYVPEYGLEDAPVGDDLMEWLNIQFIEPSTEEGDHLSALESPWEDEMFWPYLLRATLRGLSKAATFFLGTLSRHSSNNLRRLSAQISPLLVSQPRLQDFSVERDFAYASHRWKDKIKVLRIELDGIPEADRQDEFENWWDRLSDLVGILEGRGEIIQKVCEDLGADWKEVCVAWGVFADTRLRRQDLPDIVPHVLEDMPPDPTNMEDVMHAALFNGDPVKALVHAAQIDPWLAAHLADLMEILSLMDKEPNLESGLSLRNYHVLSYAHYLHSDPALWRITVAYMYSCGDIGTRGADEVLTRVPLKIEGTREADGSLNVDDLAKIVKDINATCYEFQREEVRRVVCRVAAQTFVQKKEYGLALSYCSSAEDWPGLGRVVDRVLQEYINAGPEQFTYYVASIAPSLQAVRTQPGAQGIFIHRLVFAVRYAEFHQRLQNQDLYDAAWDLITMFQEDLVPKSWWGAILCEAAGLLQHKSNLLFSYSSACLLLQRLEEVFTRADQGSGDDYLRVLITRSNGSTSKDALNQLQVTRLALAKYFARCAMIGTGGKQLFERRV
ncbi:nucleoporin Nup85-like protein [Hygrophoropsis aurantiaca]|uniref:Nucleoporin Nup85-like protein n=1 Tax=Hygrophoropsis aurantiaca TaxID=72124 RepID=A0ACB7ZY50_9AGAM|nr:nucleoporin Nup85-like protein [Hygrophoropsis aurantiaca]